MSKLKVNELDTESGTTITVTAGKTLDVPATSTLTVTGTQTVTGTANLTASTLTLPTTLPATAGTNITGLPAANLTGQVPTSSLDNVQLAPLEDDIAVLGFQLAATQDVNKYNLQDQIIDTFQDNSGVDAALSTNETRSAAGKYYSGVAGNTGTGGTESSITISSTDYLLHTFNADGTLDLDQDTTCDVLVVGGGGGGGRGPGANGTGGGGAGGLVYQTGRTLLDAQTYTITVGAGGTAGQSPPSPGTDGGVGANSVFADPVSNSITALGGGYGKGLAGGNGGAGGSGGGGTANPASTTGGAGNQADSGGGTGFGNAGGGGHNPSRGGGGGGGAGAAGTAGSGSYPNAAAAGPGGAGKDYSSIFGTAVGVSGWFAGGGGGCAADQATGFGTGGQGGGGAGNAETASPLIAATPGTANTGGGGGGSRGAAAGTGGKGVVIVRYALGGVAGNMTLVSTANTGTGTITNGDIVILYTPVAGTTVLNTNIKAYVSRDNGTTYTQGTLVGKGSYSGTTSIASVHDIDISGQPAGVAMRWKIETLVQSAALETNINGVSLGWS